MTNADWKQQPIPASVLRLQRSEAWEWVSPRRLRAPHPKRGFWWIAVVDAEGGNATLVPADGSLGDDHLAREWADLFDSQARYLARQAACHDGVPPRADHDQTRCAVCGLLAAEHDVPGTVDGLVRQQTHVHWPGLGDMTTGEAEASLGLALTDLAEGHRYRRAFEELDDEERQ